MRTIPIDSADAREQREAEAAELEAERAERQRHAEQCRGGWLGLDSDERPKPCRTCRPHLARVQCRGCSAPWQSCTHLTEIGRGRCCDDCDHAATPTSRVDR